MSVWSMPPVDMQPGAQLARWRVYRFVLGDQRWDVLSGWDVANGCGRCSTPVIAFEPAARTVRTRSGRLYVLEAEPGDDDDARYVFESRYGTALPEGFRLIDATGEYQDSIAKQAIRPIAPVQRSLGLRAITVKAETAFGDADKAARWLMSHSPFLAATPLSLVGSKSGRRLVYDELLRIESGDFC